MFRRVLIANRGEIALRLIAACTKLGIESVVVYSEADRSAPWLRAASRSVCIGPARSSFSYLDPAAILQAAEQCECQAIHPGYGFLSENPRFAARCEQQGFTFIGPGAHAMRRMGDKSEAKRTMTRAGIPVIPGSDGPVADLESALRTAAEVGYPVLLKAVAGGGGRGMRRCDSASDLQRSFAEAAAEAEAAFSDARLYLEKFIDGARHIEFQLLCDGFGNAIHLGERDCSVQRNHQKLLEESPSSIASTLRTELGERLRVAVSAIGYRSAGTVEFLLSPAGTLFFIEMNARLQVEHPVSELVTGVDIVEQQLRVAANQQLSLRQDDIVLTGHAIELRINAEDPANHFRPATGVITDFTPPPVTANGTTVRWDSAIEKGYRVPPHYDSLIGKLIVHAADRDAAISLARSALAATRIEGIATTSALHAEILRHPAFVSGKYDLTFLGSLLARSATQPSKDGH